MASYSLNDIAPKNEQLNKIQRKKVKSLIDQSPNAESALVAVRNYCMGLSKIKIRSVVLTMQSEVPTIEVFTSNTTHYFKLPFQKEAE
jgi:hypothetical protein